MFSGQMFFDNTHFPRGFARSGYFTIKEAQLLESYGRAMKALFDGSQLPETEEEQVFVEEVHGRRAAKSAYALCWLKYLQKINHKHVVYNLCSTSRNSELSEAEIDE